MTTIGRFHTISDLFCKTVSFGPFPDRDYIALLWLIHGEIKQYTQHIATRDTLQRSQIYFAKPFRVVHFPIVIILPFYDWFMGKSSSTRNTLQHATHCNTLQHIVTHCNTLQHIATHCTTLQHIAPHCNTLQHIATHCNTLHHTTSSLRSLNFLKNHMYDMTHSRVWYDCFTCLIWLVYMCDMTHSHVWRDSVACAAWIIHIHVCGMTH